VAKGGYWSFYHREEILSNVVNRGAGAGELGAGRGQDTNTAPLSKGGSWLGAEDLNPHIRSQTRNTVRIRNPRFAPYGVPFPTASPYDCFEGVDWCGPVWPDRWQPPQATLLLPMPDRKGPHPDLSFGHTGDNTLLLRFAVLLNNLIQVLAHPLWSHIAQTKYDNAGETVAAGGHQLAKVQIVREKNSTLVPSQLQDGFIIQPLETQFVDMNRIMPLTAQVRDTFRRDTHVRQESHAVSCSRAWTDPCSRG